MELGKKTVKSIIRKVPKTVNDVAVGVVGLGAFMVGRTNTAYTLWNSMGPSSNIMTEKSFPGIVDKIQDFAEFKDAINNIVQGTPDGFIDVKKQQLTFRIGFLNDLGLALHDTRLSANGTLINGKGTLNITIDDDYDFEYDNDYGKSGFLSNIVKGFNNMAYAQQKRGLLNNYDIIIKFDYTIN